MDAATELGRNPVSKHQIQPEYRDEQADAGRDCRTRLARPNSQGHERGQGTTHFLCSADHEQDWQPYPHDPYSSCYMCDHTYIHEIRLAIGCGLLNRGKRTKKKVWQHTPLLPNTLGIKHRNSKGRHVTHPHACLGAIG